MEQQTKQTEKIAVYQGNQFLDEDSLKLKGIFSNLDAAIEAILDNHEFQYSDFFDDEYFTDYNVQYYRLRDEVKRILLMDSQVTTMGLGYLCRVLNEDTWLDN